LNPDLLNAIQSSNTSNRHNDRDLHRVIGDEKARCAAPDTDLARLVSAWATLSPALRASILALVDDASITPAASLADLLRPGALPSQVAPLVAFVQKQSSPSPLCENRGEGERSHPADSDRATKRSAAGGMTGAGAGDVAQAKLSALPAPGVTPAQRRRERRSGGAPGTTPAVVPRVKSFSILKGRVV